MIHVQFINNLSLANLSTKTANGKLNDKDNFGYTTWFPINYFMCDSNLGLFPLN